MAQTFASIGNFQFQAACKAASLQRQPPFRSVLYRSGRPATKRAGNFVPRAASSASSPSGASEPYDAASTSGQQQEQAQEGSKGGPLQRLKRFFVGEKMDKQRLAELGMGAVASYGFLSNLVYCTGMAVTWVMFVKQRGVSPLAQDQWPAYLAFYAGFWTINNFIRPFRFGIAVAMAPVFDRALETISRVTGFSKRNAFGLYLFALGSVTCVLTFGSIGLLAGPQAFAR